MNLATKETELQTIVSQHFPASEAPGCCVLIIDKDETLTICAGLANVEQGAAVRPSTNFRLASVAKQFTAASILKLRDEGRLRLGQRLTDFFPEFPDYGWAISVEHLLRHTSGIKDYEPLVENQTFDSPVMDAEVLQLLAKEDSGDFEPGSRFRYSNSGYAVLSQVVEQITGLDFPTYLKQAFFQPLGMANTIAFVNRPDSPAVSERAMGYARNQDGTFFLNDQSSTSSVLGDGGIYTSAVDYERWIRSYMGGTVLKAETVQQAWSPAHTTSGDVVPYGYGWRLEQQESHWLPYHPGSTTGFRNGVVVDPKGPQVVLVLSNRSNGDAVALAKAVRDRIN